MYIELMEIKYQGKLYLFNASCNLDYVYLEDRINNDKYGFGGGDKKIDVESIKIEQVYLADGDGDALLVEDGIDDELENEIFIMVSNLDPYGKYLQ